MDISIQIDQTVEQVKDACLGLEQEAAVLSKLEELKAISQGKDKRKRWDKVKGILSGSPNKAYKSQVGSCRWHAK